MVRASALLSHAGFAPHHRIWFSVRPDDRPALDQMVRLLPETTSGSSALVGGSAHAVGQNNKFLTAIDEALARMTPDASDDLPADTQSLLPPGPVVAELVKARHRILFQNDTAASVENVSDENWIFAPTEGLGYTIAPEVDAERHWRLTVTLRSSRSPRRPPWTEKSRRHIALAMGQYLTVPVSLGFGPVLRHQHAGRIAAAMHVGSNPESEYTTTMVVDRDVAKLPNPAVAELIGTGSFVVLPGHPLVEPNNQRKHSTVFHPHDKRSKANEAARVENDGLTAYNAEHGVTNALDCSLAKVTAAEASLLVRGSKRIIGYRSLTLEDRDAEVGVCRNDGSFVRCKISGIAVDATVLGPVGTIHPYLGVFVVENLETTAPVTHPGDSGAPVVFEESGGYVICGLVIAGSDRKLGGTKPQTLALPIDRVMAFYGVKPKGVA
jgi:hypothetical protein